MDPAHEIPTHVRSYEARGETYDDWRINAPLMKCKECGREAHVNSQQELTVWTCLVCVQERSR